MNENQIREMRERIAALDSDLRRGLNLALDEIILANEGITSLTQHLDRNAEQISQNASAIAESRRDIDQLAQRTGELADSIGGLRQNQQLLTFTIAQVAESMTILRQTQQTFVEQAVADRQTFQAEIRRIWEYLLEQRPNGRGE